MEGAEMILKVKRLTETAKLPTKAHHDDAGYDLYSAEDFHLGAGEKYTVPTGIAISIPPGYHGEIRPRSGLARKGIVVVLGTIDSGYIGEIGVMIYSRPCIYFPLTEPKLIASGDFIRCGDRIAQLVIVKNESPEIVEVSDLGQTNRGTNGFGSSGA